MEELLKRHSDRSVDTVLFKVSGVSLTEDRAAVATHLGPAFVAANHLALQHPGDKSLTVTRVRFNGEDGFKLKEIINGHDLSTGPVRPAGNELFDSLIISPGPDW